MRGLPWMGLRLGAVRRRPKIQSWAQFEREIRARGCNLLRRLDTYPDAILVAGCQRSGTTALTRLLKAVSSVGSYSLTHDDELDAALILSGTEQVGPLGGRGCFQTTYLNNCYREYLDHHNYRLVWVVRNPYSVVWSMVHHWRRAALQRLFRTCVLPSLEASRQARYELLGSLWVSPLEQACLAYNAKVDQLEFLAERLPWDQLRVIEYEDLIARKIERLPLLFSFFDLEYESNLHQMLDARPMQRRGQSRREAQTIERMCQPSYERARQVATNHGLSQPPRAAPKHRKSP